MSPPPMRGIRHVALICQDLATMERFYCDVLGYRVEWRPSQSELYLTSGRDNLALHERAASAGSPLPVASESKLDHIGLLMDRPEDVDAWAKYLQEKRIKLDTAPRTHRDGARSFYLRDPEGNRLQFLYHPPLSRSE
ncbi:MAG TPA: VOC family protein [Polyangiaceae bacterium]|nr:VOC family protein [Polyangiaceae bacterium]